MSMFSFPDAMTPDVMMKSMPDMTEWTSGLKAVTPLMTHPVAACAAATALGFGVASHMSGLFWGAVEAAIETPLRFAAMTHGLDSDAAETKRSKPIERTGGRIVRVGGGVAHIKTAADAAVIETAAEASAAPAIEVLDAAEMRRPPEREKPERADDLKRISGIGPKLEQVLNGLGIWTFGQVAALTSAETAWLDDYLQFRGRIERDAWRKQAVELMDATH